MCVVKPNGNMCSFESLIKLTRPLNTPAVHYGKYMPGIATYVA